MSWPIPLPTDIADRAAGVLESEVSRVFQAQNPGAPPPPVDARSPTSVLAIYARTLGLTGFDLWLYQGRLAQELMVDTAVDWLWRHGYRLLSRKFGCRWSVRISQSSWRRWRRHAILWRWRFEWRRWCRIGNRGNRWY